ncbi:MAG TPA: alpha/beta fold hydrolase [Burkholderiaceae bacterium]|nr:alpha/beta fold hydrolase [Burkholderiaceae bacterium]
MRFRPRLLRILACLLLLALAGGYVMLDRWQRATIFAVETRESPWWRKPPQGTEIFDLTLENGDTVRAWYVAPPAAAGAATVLYLHGARWNLNDSAFRIERWVDMGYAVLAIDYRGFGASTARLPSQSSAVEDAGAALRELARRQPTPALRFIYGHSLGGAIAVALASKPDQPDFAGLILESTFTRIQDMIAGSRWEHIPGLALVLTQPFDSLNAIKQVRKPILFLHGTNDRVVPHTMSDALMASAIDPGLPRRLVKIDGASHSGASSSGIYRDAVRSFTHDASQAMRRTGALANR